MSEARTGLTLNEDTFSVVDWSVTSCCGSRLSEPGSRFARTGRKTSRKKSFHINGMRQIGYIYMHGEIPFNVPFWQTSRLGKRPVPANVPSPSNVPSRETLRPGKRPVPSNVPSRETLRPANVPSRLPYKQPLQHLTNP